MKRAILRYVLPAILVFAAAVFLLNTSLLAPARSGKPLLIAHRGLGQPFSRDGLTGETCTAARMLPSGHPYIENTIAAFEAAFAAGADVVEFDVQPTTDGRFAVFHDWALDCRTEGTGETRARALAELKALDVGYGYTSDGGKTFPFRGKGVGLMPTLDEVLATFPDRRFLINVKSRDAGEGERLGSVLAALPAGRRSQLMVYGAEPPIAAVRGAAPDVRTLSTDRLETCLLGYVATGWFGRVPPSCERSLFMLPMDYAPWVWGFPARLLARLDAADTLLVLLGPYDGTGFSTGIDDSETAARIPAGYDGYVWTNRIDLVGPALRR